MKKINKMDYLLSLGIFILFFAGSSLLFSDLFASGLAKTLEVTIVALLMFILALVSRFILNVRFSNKVAYTLGCFSLGCAFVLAGAYQLFGSWYSFMGDGVHIFLASIAILIGILSILTLVLYKNYTMIHLTFIANLVMLFHLFIYFEINLQIVFIVISGFLLVTNVFKFNKYLEQFSNVAIYVLSLVNLIFGYGDNFFLSSVLLGLNILGISSVLSKSKTLESELFGLIALAASGFIYSGIVLEFISNLNVAMLVLVAIIVSFDLINNTFNLFKNKFVKILYKIVSIICLWILLGESYSLVALGIAVSFIIVVSLINSFVIHNDDFEKYFLPIKLALLSLLGYNLANSFIVVNSFYFITLATLCFALGAKYISKSVRPMYVLLTIFTLFMAAGSSTKSILEVVVYMVALILSYMMIRSKNDQALNGICYSVLVLMSLAVVSLSDYLALIVSIIGVGVFAYLNRNHKYNFCISMVFIAVVFTSLIEMIIKDFSIQTILTSLMYFILIGLTSEMIFETKNSKNIFATILFAIFLLPFLDLSINFLGSIFALIVALVLILISLKSDTYKGFYYLGIVSVILNLLFFVRFLEGLPVGLYLVLIGFVLIGIVSVMIVKYNNRDDAGHEENVEVNKQLAVVKKEATKVVKEKINYCPECGSKINHLESFCAECGTKIR